jgi:hypothetical protein
LSRTRLVQEDEFLHSQGEALQSLPSLFENGTFFPESGAAFGYVAIENVTYVFRYRHVRASR